MSQMIKVKVSTITARKETVIDSSNTIQNAFDEANVQLVTGMSVQLNGQNLGVADLNKTFDDFNITESATLMAVTNAKNA